VIVSGGLPRWVTLEDPWNDNETGISCIPVGTYRAVRRVRPSNGQEAFYLEDVPGRTAILIHTGNTIKDTEGCILLGRSFGYLSMPAILSSNHAMKEFMRWHQGKDEFILEITD
jgi:hypothetical protein